jgi:hypothetical protein
MAGGEVRFCGGAAGLVTYEGGSSKVRGMDGNMSCHRLGTVGYAIFTVRPCIYFVLLQEDEQQA